MSGNAVKGGACWPQGKKTQEAMVGSLASGSGLLEDPCTWDISPWLA